jgi:NADPH2:quinone reductase
MRAVVIKDISNRDSVGIDIVADPRPRDDEVVVDVKACGINFTDLLSLDGKYQNNPPPPFTPGKDAAGVISAVGAKVKGLKIGDRVLAHVNHGAMAEKVACPSALACPIPKDVAFDAAAAMGLAYLTAWFALKVRGGLEPGEIVLIDGASGGVGLAAVGLAKALGAGKVLAGLTSPAKADAVKAAGADATIDLSADNLKDSLRDQVAAATGGKSADLVVDMVGGAVFDSALRAIGDAGRIVVVGFASGAIPAVRTNYLLLKNISVVGMTVSAYMKARSPAIAEAQAAMFDLLRAGKIDPHIMKKYRFEDFMAGIEMLENRSIVGKSVLLIGSA